MSYTYLYQEAPGHTQSTSSFVHSRDRPVPVDTTTNPPRYPTPLLVEQSRPSSEPEMVHVISPSEQEAFERNMQSYAHSLRCLPDYIHAPPSTTLAPLSQSPSWGGPIPFGDTTHWSLPFANEEEARVWREWRRHMWHWQAEMAWQEEEWRLEVLKQRRFPDPMPQAGVAESEEGEEENMDETEDEEDYSEDETEYSGDETETESTTEEA